MYNLMVVNFFLMGFSSLLLCKVYKHYLMVLMCLEFMVLVILFSVYFSSVMNLKEVYYLILMVFFVIESVLGLSILVSMMHFKGNDYLSTLSLMMW